MGRPSDSEARGGPCAGGPYFVFGSLPSSIVRTLRFAASGRFDRCAVFGRGCQYEVYDGRVAPDLYTAVCRLCWKGASADMMGSEPVQVGSDTTSSSSSSESA